MVHQGAVLAAGICSAGGFVWLNFSLVYSKTENKIVAIIFLSVGFLGGIFLAEFIRRKYGLEKFFANLYGSAAIKDRPKQ